VAIGPGTEKRDVAVCRRGVFGGNRSEISRKFLFGKTGSEIQRGVSVLGGNITEQVVEDIDTDNAKHFGALRVGRGDVWVVY
jgi:hypothetical protein